MSLTTELIKEAMRGANNLSNESPLANQFMNVLSQQQAQKARENQMMQQFLMERRMKEEDFNRKVEFAKMFSDTKEGKQQQERENKMIKEQEAKYKKMKPINDELAKSYIFTKTSVDTIDNAIPILNSEAFRSAQEKLKNRIIKTTGLHKMVEYWIASDVNKAGSGMDHLSEQVSNLIKEGKLSQEEVDAITTATNVMKDTTNSLIQSRKQKQGLGTFNINLSTKYNAFLNSPDSLIEALKQNREEFGKRYIEEYNIAEDKTKLYQGDEMSLVNQERYNPKMLNVIIDEGTLELENALKNATSVDDENIENEINNLSPREKQYFESQKDKKSSEQILKIIKRNRK